MSKVAHREDTSPQTGEHKYGDVQYADPTNKKYPIDTEEHVRAAWSYINQADNAAKYSAEDLKTIKDHIRSAAKKFGIDIAAKSFEVTKQANGIYRWRGYPSNNVKDRDKETVGRSGLEEVVPREKAAGNYPPLQFFHIDYNIGTTDYYAVVDGILMATGEFNDDPVSKAIAQYYVDHPEGIDGSGWAMSWRFWSNPDGEGTYQRIKGIKEFTFLPFSRAANQITEFSVEVSKDMALTEEQRKALDVVLDSPDLMATVEQALAAKKKSAELDAAGAQRKSAEEPVVETAKDKTSKPGQQVENQDESTEDEADTAKCANCGHAQSKHTGAKASGGKCSVAGCDCGGYKAKNFVADDMSDKLAEDVAKFVAEEVAKARDELVAEVNKALTLVAEAVKDLQEQTTTLEETEKAIQSEFVSPQITGAYERLKAKAASKSQETKIEKDNPLAQQHPAEIETGANDVFTRVGLQ